MKRILIVIGIILLVGNVTATTHTVCASGCDFTTIQAAVTAAAEYDTVYVYNGTYTENVNIATGHLELEGEGRDVVTVNAIDYTDHVFDVSANYVNISEFTVSGATNISKSGVYLMSGNGCAVSNNTISNNGNGITSVVTSGSIFSNNNIISNGVYGVYLAYSSDTISNNIISHNYMGISMLTTTSSNINNNTFLHNRHIYWEDGLSNYAFADNIFLHNIGTYSNLGTDAQEGSVGVQIDFNFTMKDIDNIECPTCSYNLNLCPSEASLQHSANGGNPALVEGNFTPTRQGIYSLQINVTDSDSNSETRKYTYIIGDTSSDTVDYFFRDAKATQGQPVTYGTNTDAGSLLFVPANSDEEVYCGIYVGLSIDEYPNYLFGIFREINYSIWYKTDDAGSTGVHRYATTLTPLDYTIAITTTPKTFDTFNFSVDWGNDYFWTWYFMTVGLNGIYPSIYSNATDSSYANITYSYSTTPAIKSISNDDILLFSATSPATDNKFASIVLDGIGTTNLTVQMPNTALSYNATYDGSPCNDASCSFTQSNGELNFMLTLGSEHEINITPITYAEIPETGNPFQGVINIIDAVVSIITSLLSLIVATFPIVIALALLSALFILITTIVMRIR